MSKLYFRTASMNAGKSTALLQVAHNYEEQKCKVVIYTAAIDNRYGVGMVTARIGIQREALLYDNQTDFYAAFPEHKGLSCILIDEAQFLTPDQVRQLHRYAHLEQVPIICYGLRTDFQGRAFPGAAELLALADSIDELKNICSCGKKATMNVRIDENGKRVTEGNQVEIGGNSRYRQSCARCFYLGL